MGGSHNVVGIRRKKTLDLNVQSNAFSPFYVLLACIG